MTRTTLVLVAACLLFPSAVEAQKNTEGWSLGIGVGVSKITGTPTRPRPREGDFITGAGSAPLAPHIRLLAERQFNPAVALRAEIFGNRFTTPDKTYNCIRIADLPSGFDGTCYPAAKVDLSIGFLAGSRIGWLERKLQPSLQLAVGAAHYTLIPNHEWFFGLQGASGVRPIFKAGLGGGVSLRSVNIQMEAGLIGSLGAGGGADQIPITINILWK